ncbi:MOLPALP family lipoprotein [Spiroplasma endosymbiont of Diplazon laetatorius]|uniref:MOLPALP family lipoprotein n=1 Tax=Spiroplasma endosymbiont of Diplazon laetatorius TaxID=3066322 RepID=UPI0030CE79A7
MKKLLSLLGAATMTFSTVGSVIACGDNTPVLGNNFDTEAQQDTISKLMTQYAKSLYLNQKPLSDGESHYSSKYTMENDVKNAYLKDLGLTDFDESENVQNNSKFSTIANKYFDPNSLLASDLKISDNIYQDYAFDPSVKDEGILDTIKNTLPQLLEFLSDPSQLQGLLGLVAENPEMIESILSPEILKTLGKVLSNEKLQILQNAFSADIYKDMNNQTALNSSVIGLSNALDKFIKGKDAVILSYATQKDVDSNYDQSTTSLADNIKKLMDKEVEFKFDLIENVDSIAEIIRFVRTLLVYIEQFSYDEMTSNILTLEQIEAKRTAKFSTNSIDLKQVFKKLKYMVNDEEGVTFKNYIGILLATNSTNFKAGSDFKEKVNSGLMDLLSKVAIKANGAEYVDATIMKIYINSIVRSFINAGLKPEYGGAEYNTIKGLIFSVKGMLPEFLGNILDKIDKNGDKEEFQENWLGYLWHNTNEKLGFSLMKLMQTPLNKIDLKGLMGSTETFAINSSDGKSRFNEARSIGTEFLTDKSIKEIVEEFDTAFSKTTKSTIKFDDYSELIGRLIKDDTLQKALNDIKNMFEILGYNSDGTLKEGSVFEQFFKILEDSKELVAQSNSILKKWVEESNTKIENLVKEATQLFKKLTVTTKRRATNDFEYTVTDGSTEYVFNVKLKQNASKTKLVISEINLVK